MVILNHLTPPDVFVNTLVKAMNRHMELKQEIAQKIKTTRGGEQLSWIKKYNGLFIERWKQK